MAKSSFKLSCSLEERIQLCTRLRNKYTGTIPVLLEKANHSDVPDIGNKKFLFSSDTTVGSVEAYVRKETNLAPEKPISVLVGNTLCPRAALISAMYQKHKEEDGFLYIKYTERIPLVLEKSEHSDVPDIGNKKVLLLLDITIGKLEDMLRTKTHTAAEKPIFFFVGNTICPTAASVSAIYEEHKDEDGFLYMSYAGEDLLSTMKTALSIAGSILREKGTERLQELPETWLPYLSTLEKMVSISGLDGVLRGGLDGFCGLITCYAEIGDLSWVMKLKEFTNFEARRHLASLFFPSGLGEFEELSIEVDRSTIFEDSVVQVNQALPLLFQGGVSVTFNDEVAYGEGVFTEWIRLVSDKIFDPTRSLFRPSPDDPRRFSVSPLSYEDKSQLALFRFAGRIICLSLRHAVQVGVLFDPLFFLQLQGKEISLEDIAGSDKALHKSLKDILDMDGDEFDEQEGFGLYFAVDVTKKTYPLCLNGSDLAVTSKNRERYVELMVKHCFTTQIQEQLSSFSRGFEEMLSSGAESKTFFSILELKDLDSMLRGTDEDTISVKQWKARTEYEDYQESDDVIRWFWKAVRRLDNVRRRNLLCFWTARRFLPKGGFEGLDMCLTICKKYGDPESYPTSQTCLYALHLPEYESYMDTEIGICLIADEELSSGFGLE